MKIKDFIRGDSRNITVTFLQSDNATPVDLSGGTVYFTLNSSSNPSDDTGAAIQKTITDHTDAVNGQTTISLTNADTDSLTPGTYYYDVQFKDPVGNVLSQKPDTFTVIADITRRIA